MARPQQPGLTENELEVMKILWTHSPLKISDVLEKISRLPKPAYTSVLTLMQAMEKKGYIGHHQDGSAYAYFPVLQEKFFKKSEIKRISKRLFNGGPLDLVMSLVKDEQLSREEIEQLKKILAAK